LFSYLTTFYDTHTHTRARSHTIGRNPLYDGSARRRPLFDKVRHSQETEILAPRRIKTRNPSKGAALDLCVRPGDHGDREQ